MKALWVTDRRAAGDERFEDLLGRLAGTPGLSVQLRERATADRACLDWAKRARARLGRETPLYVNRRLDIAIAAEADGVHLPASGLPLSRARRAAPRGLRIGVSTHSAGEAARAIQQGADLVVLGPIFETPSKREYGPPLGPESLSGLPLRAEHGCEVFAIGGLNAGNVARLDPWLDRIDGIAGIRYFQDAEDPRGAVEALARRAAC
jgi:thiamine-phosphate pyrophosphorylase